MRLHLLRSARLLHRMVRLQLQLPVRLLPPVHLHLHLKRRRLAVLRRDLHWQRLAHGQHHKSATNVGFVFMHVLHGINKRFQL